MIEKGLKGVDFIIVDTNIKSLIKSTMKNKIQIGVKATQGLGAGADPAVGLQAAQENRHEIKQALEGAKMVFITAGMGGGTGRGAAPVVAEIAKDLGALTIGIVTKQFSFEGKQKQLVAEEGIKILKNKVDALITINNDNLFQIIKKNTSLVEAFKYADDVLRQAVQAVTDLIVINQEINLDFADITTIMHDAGTALIGIGEGHGEHRAVKAAEEAINNPLLDSSINGARGVILCIFGPKDMTLHETTAASEIIYKSANENANIIRI